MTPAEQSGAIDIDGRRYAWRSLGAGPPLVLLNGYSASAQDWDPTLLGELAASFTVICPDHRGIGQSDIGDPGDVTIAAMADDAERLLDDLGLARAACAGWSMGGFVAQRLAIGAPGRIESLVLMGTDPGGPSAVRCTADAWSQLTDCSGTPREQATRLIPLLFPPALVPAIDAAFGDLMAEARAALSLDALRAQQQAMSAWHGVAPPAPDPSDAPRVLVLTGSEDVVIPPENVEQLAALWPRCESESFVGGGHAFFALEPQRVAARITRFCRP